MNFNLYKNRRMIDIVDIQNENRYNSIVEEIVILWEQSVKATHIFLSNSDIISLIPDVKKGVKKVEKLVLVKDKSNKIIGFMGIENNKIEMLFISPEYFGIGIGKKLVNYGITQYNIKYVDVNEQNSKALNFYKHIGFNIFNRSELDDQGNPFPILHLELNHKIY